MLRTLPHTRDYTLIQRLAMVSAFTLLTIIASRLSIYMEPVPLTLQSLAVLLAGTVLGARDGALSQMFYVGLIALGFPFDSRGLGAGVFLSPTWGYLVAFIPAAFIAGTIVERFPKRMTIRLSAGLVGGAIILFGGVLVLKAMTDFTWTDAIARGVTPFLPGDIFKAVLVAGITESTRKVLLRVLSPSDAIN